MKNKSPAGFAWVMAALLAGCGSAPGSSSEALGSSTQAATSPDAGTAATPSDVVLTWDGPSDVFPATLSETPGENYDANFCELFVNGFGQGNFSEDGATVDWLEAYVSVPAQDGQLLAVAMYTRSQDSDGVHDYITLGTSIAANYWKTGFTTFTSALGSSPPVTHTVIDFAFFIDVQRPSGDVVRLWQSNHGGNYTVAEVFSLPPSNVLQSGAGSTTYASNASGIFAQKLACD